MCILNIYIINFSKEYNKLLQQKYVGIVGKPKWAKITGNDAEKVLPNDDEDLDLLKVNMKLLFVKKITCTIFQIISVQR